MPFSVFGRSLLLSASLLAACSSTSTPSTPTDGGGTSAPTPDNTGWCTPGGLTSCNGYDVCGVCVPKPTKDATRTADTREYAGSGPVDVSCFDAAKIGTVGTSNKVKLQGYVKIFANGPDSKNVKIEIFEEQLDDKGVPNGKIGATPIATGFSDAAAPGFPPKVETITKKGVDTNRTLYGYVIDGVPTEKPLVIKTSGKTVDDGWFALYDYGQGILNSETKDGIFAHDVRALGNDDYASILKAAYSRPPEGGQSAIAGEVHDCGDIRVSYATVAIEPKSPLGLFYLSEVEDDPLPKSSLSSTDRLGLYAVGGLTPGVFSVSALAKVGGAMKTLGSYRVQTFSDSVSVYTFRGLRPWQVAKK